MLHNNLDSITEPREPSTGGAEATYDGFRAYSARATYPPSNWDPNRPDKAPVLVKRLLGGDWPFDNAPASTIQNAPGWATFAADPGYEARSTKQRAKMVISLDGSRRHAHTFYQFFESIIEYATGRNISGQTAIYREFQRGDAKEDLDWDPSDDMNSDDSNAIAEYRVGILPLSGLNAVNAATPQHNNPEDKIDMVDALFIAQLLTAPPLRNDYFEWTGGSLLALSGGGGGQATLEVASVTAAAGVNVRVPITLKGINSAAGVGVYEIRIAFDPKLLKVESVEPGGKPFDRPPFFRIDNNTGVVAIAGYHTAAPGAKTDTVIGNLVVTPLGQAGKTAELKPFVTTLADVLGNSISSAAVAGTLLLT